MKSILGNTRKADIIFNASGKIDITARVAKTLELQPGDVVDIMHSNEEFYLYIKHHAPVDGRHDGTAIQTNQRGNHFRVQSKALCTAILQECKADKKVKLRVGETVALADGEKAISIITRNILV